MQFVESRKYGEEEVEEILEEETSIQVFNNLQEHVIIVDKLVILHVPVTSQAGISPEEASEVASEEDLGGNHRHPEDR